MATRHKRVVIDRSCRISPEARIHPRRGAIDIGSKTVVSIGVILQGNVSIGNHCSVQPRSILVGYGTYEDPAGKITIGDNVRIAPHVMMFGTNHSFSDISYPIYLQGSNHAPIVIQDDVWIGGGVIVTAGVTIGYGSVVGAGSVVTKDISPYSICAGIPAKPIGSRVAKDSDPTENSASA